MKNILWMLIASSLFFACTNEKEEDRTLPAAGQPEDDLIYISESQFTGGNMALGTVTEMDIPYTILANGLIDVPPGSKAAVSSYHGGYVKNLDLLPGERIKKGQVLFHLENPEFVEMQQAYLEVKEQLDFLKSDYERQTTLAEENIASQKNYLKAASDYKVNVAKYTGLKKKLELLGFDINKVEAGNFASTISIYAPITGFITRVSTTGGAFLNKADIAVEITNTDHLHLELEVFEKDASKLKENQPIFFRIPGETGERMAAKVYLIGSQVEGENRIVKVHGHLDKGAPKDKLLPGMYIEAMIVTTGRMVKALPEESVVNLEETDYVLVQKDRSGGSYTFEKMPVSTGLSANGYVEITNPEAIGMETPVLIKGAFNLIQ